MIQPVEIDVNGFCLRQPSLAIEDLYIELAISRSEVQSGGIERCVDVVDCRLAGNRLESLEALPGAVNLVELEGQCAGQVVELIEKLTEYIVARMDNAGDSAAVEIQWRIGFCDP